MGSLAIVRHLEDDNGGRCAGMGTCSSSTTEPLDHIRCTVTVSSAGVYFFSKWFLDNEFGSGRVGRTRPHDADWVELAWWTGMMVLAGTFGSQLAMLLFVVQPAEHGEQLGYKTLSVPCLGSICRMVGELIGGRRRTPT